MNIRTGFPPMRCALIDPSFAMKRTLPALLLLLLLWPEAASAAVPSESATISSIAEIRKLPIEMAARLLPVHVRARVIGMSGYRNSLFVEAGGTGIAVNRTDSAEVHVGNVVVLTGTTSPGLFAPIILASSVKVVGNAPEPNPLISSYNDLEGGKRDAQWVQVTGVVHSVGDKKLWGHDFPRALLYVDGGPVHVLLPEGTNLDARTLVDATVSMRGVCATIFNEQRQFLGVRLFVPSLKELHIVKAAKASDAFALPLGPIRSVLQFSPGSESVHRAKVGGVVTYSRPGRTVFLQDDRDGIEVQTTSMQPLTPGMRVEAAGFPTVDDYAPVLKDAVVRVLPGTGAVAVHKMRAQDVILDKDGFAQVSQDQKLIQVEGEVVGSHVRGDERIWTLRAKDTVFDAILFAGLALNDLPRMGIGSRLLITGVCLVHSDTNHDPKSFTLLMRSGGDLTVLRRSAWWTTEKAGMAGGLLGLVAFMVAVWGSVLRRQVSRQTKLIRESEQRFRQLAEYDALTGVRNRLTLDANLKRCLERCDREQTTAAVIAIDIDHFKQINDTYGHLVGDECLKAVATRLKEANAGLGLIARTGGEEFLIVTTVSSAHARQLCAALLAMFQEPLRLDEITLPVTVSIGAAMYPHDGKGGFALQKLADAALYRAKRMGRNRAVFAGDDLPQETTDPSITLAGQTC